MKLKIAIRKEKSGVVWGSVFLLDNLIIENGSTLEEVKQKMQLLLQNFYEFNDKGIELLVETPRYFKARRMVARLMKQRSSSTTEFTFNSQYFN